MRKSIKKIAATLLAATMTMGLAVTAFGAEIDPSTIPAGKTIYTITGNMTDPGWALNDDANALQETEFDGVLSMELTMPAWDETNSWMSRFSIGAFNADTLVAGWNRLLLGVPSIAVGDLGNGIAGDLTNLTQIRIAPDVETNVTVYFDTKTYGLVVTDEDGNLVDYKIGWCTNDDNETYFTPDEFATMTWDDYIAQLSADRQADLAALGVTSLPNFATLRDNLVAKLNGEEVSEETCEAYSVVGSPELGIAWDPVAEGCFVKDNGDGTYSKKLVATADGDFEFKILEDGPTFAWANQMQLGTGVFQDNASQFKLVDTVAGDEFIVTFNPETGDVTVTKNGEDFEYLVRWDTREEADADFLTKEEALAKFVPEPEEETTVEEDDTTVAEDDTTVAEDDTTAAAATTASNASTKTGDAAPIAVLVSLLGAVAVVALVAKKKEA